jgi:uncharacterized membrane protein
MDPFESPPRQRGAIGLMAVGTLLIACLFLMLAVDSGRLYLEKRKLQRVADMAALEAVSRAGNCLGSGQSSAEAYALDNARGRNDFDPAERERRFTVACGRTAASGGLRNFVVDAQGSAVQVSVSETVPASLVLGGLFGEQVTLAASAVANRLEPVGRLALRTTLATVDTQQSALLNSVFGGLLGGSVSLDAAGWQGLASTDINLLDYLDLLAVDQNLSLGDYQQVLGTDVALGDLLDVAADALSQSAGSANVGLAVAGLQALSAAVPAGSPLLRLGDVLAVQSGVTAAGLDMALNAFELAQALVQLSNHRNAAVAEVPLDIPGVGSVTLSLQVIEPPQLSAIGNLERAKADPLDPDSRIYVRTAQVRSLVSLELGSGVGTLANTVNGTLDQLAPVTSFLNSALMDLNLVGAVVDLLGYSLCSGNCPQAKTSAVQALGGGRLDISLDAGGAEVYVTDYQCENPNAPSLMVDGKGSAANLRVGKLGSNAADARDKVFGSSAVPEVEAMPVLMLGSQTFRPKTCLLLVCSDLEWKRGAQWVSDKHTADLDVLAGFGVRVESTVLGGEADSQVIENVRPLSQPPTYETLELQAGEDIVASLSSTLAGVSIQAYQSSSPNLLGGLLNASLSTVNGLLGQLQNLIGEVLSPLLDPLLNTLLEGLGIDLANAEVGANMNCGYRARLVI